MPHCTKTPLLVNLMKALRTQHVRFNFNDDFQLLVYIVSIANVKGRKVWNFLDKISTFVTVCHAVHYRCIFQEQPGCKPIGENFLPIYKSSYFILRCKCAQQNKEDLKNIGKFFSYLITSIIDLRGDQIKAPSKLAMPHDIQDDR